MLGLNKKHATEEIRNPPSDDSYSMIQALFAKNKEIGIYTLSLTILELINQEQIKCDIDLDESYDVNMLIKICNVYISLLGRNNFKYICFASFKIFLIISKNS